MHFLYIIYSNSTDRFYVGETINPSERIKQHNNHLFKGSYTKAADDGEIMLELKVENKEKALYLEGFIKRMKSLKFIQKVIDKPDILEEIWTKK